MKNRISEDASSSIIVLPGDSPTTVREKQAQLLALHEENHPSVEGLARKRQLALSEKDWNLAASLHEQIKKLKEQRI